VPGAAVAAGSGHRQPDNNACPAARLVVGPEPASVALHNGAGDRQAEPSPWSASATSQVASMKPLEDVRQIVVPNAGRLPRLTVEARIVDRHSAARAQSTEWRWRISCAVGEWLSRLEE
jgi:hypothetical protein